MEALMYTNRPSKDFRIEFVEHGTAQSVVLGFFRQDYPSKMSDDKILKQTIEWKIKVGGRWKTLTSFKSIFEWVDEAGVWGYCKHLKSRKEIHYWIGENACRISVMEFLLHEMMHVGGVHSEVKACRLAGLAAFAMETFEKDFDGNMLFQRKGADKVKKCGFCRSGGHNA
jgi:hypothetical protein